MCSKFKYRQSPYMEMLNSFMYDDAAIVIPLKNQKDISPRALFNTAKISGIDFYEPERGGKIIVNASNAKPPVIEDDYFGS